MHSTCLFPAAGARSRCTHMHMRASAFVFAHMRMHARAVAAAAQTSDTPRDGGGMGVDVECPGVPVAVQRQSRMELCWGSLGEGLWLWASFEPLEFEGYCGCPFEVSEDVEDGGRGVVKLRKESDPCGPGGGGEG